MLTDGDVVEARERDGGENRDEDEDDGEVSRELADAGTLFTIGAEQEQHPK